MHRVGMPKSITIRDVPDRTIDELASRAALTEQSLQEYLRADLIELAEAPDVEVLMARVRARKDATGASLDGRTILGHRDVSRR